MDGTGMVFKRRLKAALEASVRLAARVKEHALPRRPDAWQLQACIRVYKRVASLRVAHRPRKLDQ
jgi:hypothetical protein